MICVYCLSKLNKNNKTKDHIFPNSWFPPNTPSKLNRLTVPCCNICNLKYQIIEDDLFIRWGIGINPYDDSVKGISKKAINNINIESVYDKRRLGRKLKAMESIIHDFGIYNSQKTLKGMTPLPGIRSPLAIRLPKENLQGLGEKIIKALEFKLRNKLLKKDREVMIYYVHEEEPRMDSYYKTWNQLISKQEKIFNLGPTFNVRYGVDPINEKLAIYNIKIWNHIEFWGWVCPVIKYK